MSILAAIVGCCWLARVGRGGICGADMMYCGRVSYKPCQSYVFEWV